MLQDLADLEIPADVEAATRALLGSLLKVVAVADELLAKIAVELDKQGNELPEAMAQKFERWAARIAPLASIISGTAGIVRDLVDIPDVAAEGLQDKVAMLVFDMHLVRQAVDMMLDELGKGIPDDQFIDAMRIKFERWSERIGPLATIISSTVGLVRDLVDVPDIDEEGLDARVRMLIFDMHLIRQAVDAMLDELGKVTDTAFTDDMRIKFERWAARIAPLTNIISSTVGLVRDMVDVPDIDEQGLQDRVAMLLFDMHLIRQAADMMLDAIGSATDTDFTDDMRIKFERWAARIAPLANIISSAVGLVASLVDIKPGVDLQAKTTQLLADLDTIFITVRDGLVAIGDAADTDFVDDARVKLERWAARISPLTAIISGAVSAITGLADVKAGINVETLAGRLADYVTRLVTAFDAALEAIILSTDGLDATAEKLKLWATRVSAVATIISGGVSALKSLSEFKGGATQFIDAFIADLIEITRKLDEALSGQISEDLEKASARLTVIFGGVIAAINGLVALIGHRRMPSAWINRFVEDITEVITKLAAVEIPEGVAERVAAIGEALNPIRDIVMSTQSLVGYRALLPAWVQAFLNDIQVILQGFANLPAFNAGLAVGSSFGRGFLQGFQSAIAAFPWPVPPGGNPVAPPGIPGPAGQFYNYGSITVTAPADDLPALLDALQYAVQQG